MSKLIKQEYDMAINHMFKTFKSSSNEVLVELTPENVAIAEAMMRTDSSYRKAFNEGAKPEFTKKGEIKYGGSSAYWMSILRKHIFGEIDDSDAYYKAIEGAVAAVDRENSTHINADKVGRKEISNRIFEFGKDRIVECLKNPDETELALFEKIKEKTKPAEGIRARENISFASKFCHYACYYFFKDEEAQDNYSIYDSILKAALPKYMKHYEVKKRNLNKYSDYREAIDDILEKSGKHISRNGFDHLLWYYHKGE